MENRSINCIICNSKATLSIHSSLDIINCLLCGTYYLTYEARINIPRFIDKNYPDKRNVLSGVIRERYELERYTEKITTDNFESIIHSVNMPTGIQDRFDKVILYIYRKSKEFRQSVEIETTNYSLCYGKSNLEFANILSELGTQRLITLGNIGLSKYSCVLETKGYERSELLLSNRAVNDQCFVAMWFDPVMNEVFSKYILPAIEGQTLEGKVIENEKSYKAIKIDLKDDFNDDIVDNIISEIKKSKFVIADFTGNRGGVYFEAGFAEGLGLKVIYCCREDNFKEMHFDVNHKNYIIWKTGEELYTKLRSRISASIV